MGLRGDSWKAQSAAVRDSAFVRFVRFVVQNLPRISADVY